MSPCANVQIQLPDLVRGDSVPFSRLETCFAKCFPCDKARAPALRPD